MFDRMKALLDGYLQMGVPGYDVMVCRGGECVLRMQGGYADRDAGVPMRGGERFNFYSCSKPVTVTAVMLLVEQGRIALDDPLSAYLPEFTHMRVRTPEGDRPAMTPITLRHLFSMQAGFDYDVHTPALERARAETGGLAPLREVVRFLATQPLAFEPGTRYGYSLGHDVLAAAAEVVTGERFEDYVRRVIFTPLGMKDSSFLIPPQERAALAAQYRFSPETGRAEDCGRGNEFLFGPAYASGGAGLVSTAEDYMRFLEALRTGALFARPDTLSLMLTDQLSPSSRAVYGFNKHHGYGLGMRCPYPGLPATDFGWDGAAGAFAAVDPSRDACLIYVQHVLDSPQSAERFAILDALAADLDGLGGLSPHPLPTQLG